MNFFCTGLHKDFLYCVYKNCKCTSNIHKVFFFFFSDVVAGSHFIGRISSLPE